MAYVLTPNTCKVYPIFSFLKAFLTFGLIMSRSDLLIHSSCYQRINNNSCYQRINNNSWYLNGRVKYDISKLFLKNARFEVIDYYYLPISKSNHEQTW